MRGAIGVKKNINFLPAFLAALLVLPLAAATTARAERLPVKTYTSADGLGSSYVSDLMRDSHGFLWFATRDGLSRFDGSRFVTYRVGDKNSPPGIEQILETRSGVYWITTTGGLYRWNPQNFDRNQKPDDAANPTLDAEFVGDWRGVFYEDSAGNLWLGGASLSRLAERDGKFSVEKIELDLPAPTEKGAVEFGITGFTESRDKSLWATTRWGLLRLLPDGRKILYAAIASRAGDATDVLEDASGRIWLARTTEVCVFKPETLDELRDFGALTVRRLADAPQMPTAGQIVLPQKSGEIHRYSDFKNFAGTGNAKFLYETTDRHIWISSGNGAIEFDGRIFRHHTPEQGLTKVGKMAEDSAGNLWFAWSNGVMRLDRDGLTTFDTADGIANQGILVIGETVDGALYTGGGRFDVSRFDGARFETVRPAGLPPRAVASWMSEPIFQDGAGEWWFLTYEGLYRFAANENFGALAGQKPLAVYGAKDGFRSDLMFRVFEDSARNLWFSNRDANSGHFGLGRWTRGSGEFVFFPQTGGFPPNKSVSAFAEDGQGNFWLGFYEGGLAKLSGGRLTEVNAPEIGGVITALHRDRRGDLWIASSLSGLNRVENLAAEKLTFVSYTTANGLTSNNVRSIAEDDFGRIYVGTARGVDRISPDTGRIAHYTVNDGLAGDFVNVAYRSKDGALWFGTPNGLSRLVPQRETIESAPPVRLSGLRVAGESRSVPELGANEISNLELQHGQNNLQIEFFGIDFSPNESLRYQFMLEGADKNWSQPTEQRTVNYANLSAGNYRFLVRAVNADENSSANPAVLSFSIARPFWQQWWFLLGASSLVGLLIYAVYRYRVAQLLKLERVRTRIATDLHDDIGASLSKIAILSEVARQKVGDNGANEPLQEIAGASREMVDSMSDIVWAINPQRDKLSDLTGRMRNLASEMTELCDIGLRFKTIDADKKDLQLGADLRREIFLIFKETVNNLVKHSGCECAEIEFRLDREEFVFIVTDDGAGFDVSATNGNGSASGRGGNGLINMRKRAAALGGDYQIESEIGKGTTSVLRVPLKQSFKLSNIFKQ